MKVIHGIAQCGVAPALENEHIFPQFNRYTRIRVDWKNNGQRHHIRLVP